MADAPEQQDGGQEEEQQPRSKLPFIIAGLAIFLIIVVIIAFMVIGSGSEDPALKIATPEPPGLNVSFPQPFTTNLAPPDDQYIFSANIVLEIKPKGGAGDVEILAELGLDGGDDTKNYKARVMETIYDAIRTKGRGQVTSQAGSDNLKLEMKRKLNEFLQKGEIANVFMYGVTVN